jgi:hypothetical protein
MARPLIEVLAGLEGGLEGVVVSDSAFGDGPALWVGRREVAHLDGNDVVDVRLTRPLIRARKASLAADPRITLRRSSSDWLEVRVSTAADVAFAMALVETAVDANRPTAAAGPPPTGGALKRRRRFH